MHLILGLGNPGKEYKYTRHNVGFIVIDALAEKLTAQFKKREDYFWIKTAINDNPVVIAKPRTFVNLSGRAVKKLVAEFGVDNEKIIVVHDDADLPLGTLKVKKNSSSGGHNGVESIIQALGSKDFARIRIGIGRDREDLKDYVLSEFSSSEEKVIEKAVELSIDAIYKLVDEGIEKTMLHFNKRIKVI